MKLYYKYRSRSYYPLFTRFLISENEKCGLLPFLITNNKDENYLAIDKGRFYFYKINNKQKGVVEDFIRTKILEFLPDLRILLLNYKHPDLQKLLQIKEIKRFIDYRISLKIPYLEVEEIYE